MHAHESIRIDDHCVTVEYKNIRSLRMHLDPSSQTILLRCPHDTPHETLLNFLYKHRQWMDSARERFENKISLRSPSYEGQSVHLYMGKPYTLILSDNLRSKIHIEKEQIFCPKRSLKEREHLMEIWYDQQLTNIIQQRIKYWEPFIGKTVSHWSLRAMRTRWGSCTPSTARLRFNRALIKTPFECIDCVVLHEMVHLLEASHNHRFKALMQMHMPQWKHYDRMLNRYLLD